MTSYDYFARAEAIERISAEIYARLADDFADAPAVAATFRELADEELQHAVRILLLQKQYRSSPGLFARMERLEEELNAIEAVALGLRDELTRGAWGRDLPSIRSRLIAMEDRLHLHAETMARSADPGLRPFFEALARQDEAHRRLLAGRLTSRAGACAQQG
jgi:rubrerythrin